ncbi:MAG: hypothetical protein ACR2JF_14825 [Iamia sp.]
MSRLRLGIPVTYQFSVRYLLHTGLLSRLAEVADPVVLMGWDDEDLRRRLEAEGVEARALPQGEMGPGYLRHRRAVDLMFQQQLRSPTTAIDWYRRDAVYGTRTRLRRRARRLVEGTPGRLPGGRDRVLAKEARLLVSDTELARVARGLDDLRLDAVLSVTPYHRMEELFLRAAERAGLALVTSIISFDNPTSRPWIPVTFDRYLVWNANNRQELLRSYPELSPPQVEVTGAPQFDFYANPAWCWSEEEWREALGLSADRPVVLFGGGPSVHVPNEPAFLEVLDDAIERGEVPGRPVIVFRRHPMEAQSTWEPTLARCRHVVSDEPWAVEAGSEATSSARVADIERLVSTLAHSAVHVSTSSTLTVDGAWFDRPQVGPAFDDAPGRPHDRQVRTMYEREHWLPIAASGGMAIAHDRASLVRAVARGFTHPEEGAEGRRRILDEIITFTDGRATERVAAGVAQGLGVPAPRAGAPGAPHPTDAAPGAP